MKMSSRGFLGSPDLNSPVYCCCFPHMCLILHCYWTVWNVSHFHCHLHQSQSPSWTEGCDQREAWPEQAVWLAPAWRWLPPGSWHTLPCQLQVSQQHWDALGLVQPKTHTVQNNVKYLHYYSSSHSFYMSNLKKNQIIQIHIVFQGSQVLNAGKHEIPGECLAQGWVVDRHLSVGRRGLGVEAG